MKHKWILLIGITALTIVVVGMISLWLFGSPDGTLLRERMTGNTPQQKAQAFVQAILRGDEQGLLRLWELPYLADSERDIPFAARRADVTHHLAQLRDGTPPQAAILSTEWWSTCCEPTAGVDPREAGGARIRLQLSDREDGTTVYILDVFVRDLPYWGSAMGNPFRRWVIRDVYEEGQEPYYWLFSSAPTLEQP